MPVNRNPYYGQDIGAAFGSIAQLFAPPSGTDAYGYTKAASERQQMGIKQKLAEMANDPTLTPQQKQDALGIAANFFAPTQSNRAVDVERSTKLDTNRADNATRLKQAELENARQFAEKRYGPISEGQVLPALPKTVADMYRVPESGAVQGITKLSDGQTAFGPDGTVSRGQVTAKPGEVIMPPVSGAPQAAAPAVAGATPSTPQTPTTVPPTAIPLRTGNPAIDAILGATGVPATAEIPGGKVLPPEANQPNNATAVPEQPYGVNSTVKGGPAVGRKGQTEYEKIQDREFAKMDSKIFETAQTSFASQAMLQRVSQLLANPNLDTGALAKTGLEARKLLTTFGVAAGDVSDAEMLRSLGGQIALKLRDPSQGAGMPGALSDSDRTFLASMAPGLENSIEGNKKLVDYYSRVNQRNIDIERMRQDYVARVGRTDEGFRAEVMQFAQANPLFPEANGASPAAAPLPASGAGKPSDAHIKALQAHPERAADFEAKFGRGSAAMYLGGAK